MRRLVVILSVTLMMAVSAHAMNIQESFDPIGPVIKKFEASNGKVLTFIDEGEPDWKPVLFVGGAGTCVRVFGLTEFVRTLRTQLKLRVISVERDGFGETAYTAGEFGEDWQYGDYAGEVAELLDHLGVERFRGIAISGGGPYLATIAAAMPERIVSLHFAAALSFKNSTPDCAFDWDGMSGLLRSWITNPMIWWYLGPDTSIHAVPGFQDLAHDDGARTFFIRGQFDDDVNGVLPLETPAVAEYQRFYCSEPGDVSGVEAPVFLYYGSADTSVGPEHREYWETHFSNIAKVNVYEGEGHDVQYRHWDQILVDMAGMDDRTLVCHRGRSKLLPAKAAVRLIQKGATLGICGWNGAK
jgi:non-heme chloroperoxidase